MSFFQHIDENSGNTQRRKPKKSIPTEKKQEKIDTSTCDILFIDDQIKRSLRSKMSTLEQMQETLGELLWISTNGVDSVDKLNAKKESSLLRKAIQDVEGGFDLALYLLRTSDMLKEYRSIVEETRSTSFVRTSSNFQKDEKKIYRKGAIVQDFLRIARDYIDIEIPVSKSSKEPKCQSCHSKDLKPGEVEYTLICNKCGVELELLDDTPTFKDSERVNMAARYTYTCRGHFIEAMNRFEGKQNTDIPEKVIDILKRQLSLHGLMVDTTQITKDHIYMFLQECGFSEFYADINLIYFLVSGTNPPDITKYRNELLDMLEQLEEAYDYIKDPGRTNSLNVNWKLYKLLQLLDYPCQKDDFFCLKTPAKQGEHEEKWYEMIEYLIKRYPDVKTSNGKRRWRHIRSF